MKNYSRTLSKNHRVIITGGAGFIGSNLVDFLIEKKYKVYVFDNLSSGKKEFINKKADFIQVDVSDIKKTTALVAEIKPHAIHHLAALPRILRSVADPMGTHKANVDGTLSMLEAARVNNISKFIFASSSSVYGVQKTPRMNEKMIPNPISHYAVQKLMAEMYCSFYAKKFNMEICSLRYFNVYGDRQPGEGEYSLVIGKFLNAVKLNKELTVFGNGKQTRDYTFIEDATTANYKAMKTNLPKGKNTILNIGFGKEVSVNDLVKIIGGTAEYIYPNPRGEYEEKRKYSDTSLAKKTISWKAVTGIEKGIALLTD